MTSLRLPLLESVFCAVSLGAIVLDSERRIVLWNSWMVKHSGLSHEQVLGRDFFDVCPDLRGGRVDAAIQHALYNNFPSLLSQTLNKAPFALFVREERIQQAVEVTPIAVDAAPRHCLIQVSDVSIAVTREKLLREQAMVLRSQTFADGLTGIANRRHFDVALDRELRRALRNEGQLSLLLMDIDSFKAYNDHFGHQQGDACLTLVAEAFAATLQRPADLAARYGGEEFGAVLPDTSSEQAAQVAETIRARIAALAITHSPAATRPHVTMSIGVATFDKDKLADAAAMLAAADSCLYAAKKAGRDCVIVYRHQQENAA